MRPRSPEYYLVLVWTMTASASQVFVLAALASTIIAELDITRFQIGLLGASNTIVGALTAPMSGNAVDRFGPRRTVAAVLLWSAVGFLVTALAQSYLLLIAASVFLGIPQGAGNPSTNKLIAEEFGEGQRGVVTGIKQSGVQLGVVIAGGVVPALAVVFGWRWATASIGFVTLGVAAFMLWRFPSSQSPLDRTRATGSSDDSDNSETRGARAGLDGFVYRIAIYSFLLGLNAGGVTRFLPLFAEEELGLSESTAGLVLALTGLLAIAARLFWGRLAERSIATGQALIILAFGSALTCGLLLINGWAGVWLVWVVAIVTAFTISAWNVVAMLAVIKDVPTSQSGQASGVVLFGFLGGLSVGAPIVGFLVDATDSYQSSWALLGLVALVGAAVMYPDRTRAGQQAVPSGDG